MSQGFIKSVLKNVEKECMDAGVIDVYKALMSKELFMTISSFEELNQKYSRIGDLVKEVIKGIRHDAFGMQCSDKGSEKIASRAWQKLRAEYAAAE